MVIFIFIQMSLTRRTKSLPARQTESRVSTAYKRYSIHVCFIRNVAVEVLLVTLTKTNTEEFQMPPLPFLPAQAHTKLNSLKSARPPTFILQETSEMNVNSELLLECCRNSNCAMQKVLMIIKTDESEWGIEMNDLMNESDSKFNKIIIFKSYNTSF